MVSSFLHIGSFPSRPLGVYQPPEKGKQQRLSLSQFAQSVCLKATACCVKVWPSVLLTTPGRVRYHLRACTNLGFRFTLVGLLITGLKFSPLSPFNSATTTRQCQACKSSSASIIPQTIGDETGTRKYIGQRSVPGPRVCGWDHSAICSLLSDILIGVIFVSKIVL